MSELSRLTVTSQRIDRWRALYAQLDDEADFENRTDAE